MGFGVRSSAILVLTALVWGIAPSRGHAISAGAQRLVHWETKANNVVIQSSDPEPANYYEVPLKIMRQHVARDLSPAIRKALVFERDGKEWFRWIIHPTDTVVHPEISEMLRNAGLPDKPVQGHLIMRPTASRSLIVEDPKSGAEFSIKVSTTRAPGEWKLKRQIASDAEWVGEINEYVSTIEKRMHLEHLVPLREPWVLSISDHGVDQGVIIRDLKPVTEGKFLYLPAFSALHEETGRLIAEKNGASDPGAFWKQHMAKAYGKAMAEWSAHFGLHLGSAHPQNFLIELTPDLKPTGRIAIRDFADGWLPVGLFKGTEFSSLLKRNYYHDPNDTIVARAGFHFPDSTLEAKSWLKGDGVKEWEAEFFNAYIQEFERLTGVPASKWKTKPADVHGYGFVVLDEDALPFIKRMLPCLQGHYSGQCREALKRKLRPGAVDVGKIPLFDVIPARSGLLLKCKNLLRRAKSELEQKLKTR